MFGLYLALHSVRRGDRAPILLRLTAEGQPSPLHERVVEAVLETSRAFRAFSERFAGRPMKVSEPLLRALGNDMRASRAAAGIDAARTIGLVFFEDTHFSRDALARAASFDRIVAGWTWNAEVLRDRGVERVDVCIQGVEPSIFRPGPRSGWFADRFVVFSCGKLEFRKGQEIEDNCLAVRHQGRVPECPLNRGLDGRGESSVEEVVAALEWAYDQRVPAARLGLRGAERLGRHRWQAQTDRLFECLDDLTG